MQPLQRPQRSLVEPVARTDHDAIQPPIAIVIRGQEEGVSVPRPRLAIHSSHEG
jgi:hypothetical protein